jgi:hypothetical protein
VALGKSLVPKPDLKLEIPVGADPELDGRALALARYEEARTAAMDTVLNPRRKKSDTPGALPAFETLEPDRQLDVLKALYQRLYDAAPVMPEPPTPDPNLSRKEAKAAAAKASLEWLEAECRKRTLADPGDLDRLAQARAEAIQHALLTDTGLEPTRVFVARNGKVTTNDTPRVRLELSVK